MIADALFEWVLPFLVSAWAAWVLVAIARRTGWTDDGRDAPARKPQRVPVPLVGGFAIAAGSAWAASTALDLGGAWPGGGGVVSAVSPRSAGALLAALVLGAIDDRAPQGLPPALKFAGQVGVAVLCALAAAPEEALLTGLVALVALNAFNTFDNADGAATSLGALGLGAAAPVLAAPLLGFLPFNLWLRRRAPDGTSTPLAYLGDAGSHLLGALVALVPGAWPALLLPLLDLARLSVLRLRRGSRPWIGDRRHLAHRLQARGLGPTAVAGALLAVAAPAVLGGACSAAAPWALAAGLAGTVALFVAALRWTPDVP